MRGATSQWRSDLIARRKLICLFVAVVGVVPSAVWAFATWHVSTNGLVTMNGHMLVVRDYLWLWGAGQFLKVGDVHTIFDPHAFAAWLRGLYAAQLDDFTWSYPPSLLFLAVPAGHASILSGFAYKLCPSGGCLFGISLCHRARRRAPDTDGITGEVPLIVLASPFLERNFRARATPRGARRIFLRPRERGAIVFRISHREMGMTSGGRGSRRGDARCFRQGSASPGNNGAAVSGTSCRPSQNGSARSGR
jgi:hypothetical protein